MKSFGTGCALSSSFVGHETYLPLLRCFKIAGYKHGSSSFCYCCVGAVNVTQINSSGLFLILPQFNYVWLIDHHKYSERICKFEMPMYKNEQLAETLAFLRWHNDKQFFPPLHSFWTMHLPILEWGYAGSGAAYQDGTALYLCVLLQLIAAQFRGKRDTYVAYRHYGFLAFSAFLFVKAARNSVSKSKIADSRILMDGLGMLDPMLDPFACCNDDLCFIAIASTTLLDQILWYVAFYRGLEVNWKHFTSRTTSFPRVGARRGLTGRQRGAWT